LSGVRGRRKEKALRVQEEVRGGRPRELIIDFHVLFLFVSMKEKKV